MDRQDICALPSKMDAFGIFVHGLDSARQLLVHLSTITESELMDSSNSPEFFELLNFRISIASSVETYKDHVCEFHEFAYVLPQNQLRASTPS